MFCLRRRRLRNLLDACSSPPGILATLKKFADFKFQIQDVNEELDDDELDIIDDGPDFLNEPERFNTPDEVVSRWLSRWYPSDDALLFLNCRIKAAIDDGSLGRLVNDDHRHPNCVMKKITVDSKPHLCLFALNDIASGTELRYNYGQNASVWLLI